MKRSQLHTVKKLLKVARALTAGASEIDDVIVKCMKLVDKMQWQFDCIEHGLVDASDPRHYSPVEKQEGAKAQASLRSILEHLQQVQELLDDVPIA